MDTKEKFDLAIMKLLNIRSLRLFGCLFYNFNVNIINSDNILQNIDNETLRQNIESNLTVCVYYQNKSIQLDIFDKFIEKHSVPELIFVLAHEILHVLNNHLNRGFNKNDIIFGYACDHTINVSLLNETENNQNIKAPKETFYDKKLKHENLTSEEVYKLLYNKYKDKLDPQSILPIGKYTIQKSPITQEMEISHVAIVNDEPNQKTNEEFYDEVQAITDNLKMETKLLMDEIPSIKGNMSSSLQEYIDQLIQVEIPFEKILQKALLHKVAPSKDNRTFARPHKKLFAHGYVFPGFHEDMKPESGLIVLDSSASMSSKSLQKALSVVFQSLKHLDYIDFILHDTRINKRARLKPDQSFDEIMKINGRGGTSHKQVFDEIEERFVKNKEKVSIILIISDFDSDISGIYNRYKFIEKIPVIPISSKNPLGERIREKLENQIFQNEIIYMDQEK